MERIINLHPNLIGLLPQNCLFGLLLIPYVHLIRMENGILF